jgi:hypothetical protein
LTASLAEAHVIKLRIERREVVLNGAPFGAAGPYEKLVGKVDFGLDPNDPANDAIVDLKLAPRNARGEVESSADFYLLKPVDPRRGNGRLFYEVGNRGGKVDDRHFPEGSPSTDPSTAAEFGDGALMRQGFTLLWMGWQWDVPERPGTMRMTMPIATENGRRSPASSAAISSSTNDRRPRRSRTATTGVSRPGSEQRRERDDRCATIRWRKVRSSRDRSGASSTAAPSRWTADSSRANLRRRLSHGAIRACSAAGSRARAI